MKGFVAGVAISYITAVVLDHKARKAAPEEYEALFNKLSIKADIWSKDQTKRMQAAAERIKTKAAFDKIIRDQPR